MWATLCVFPLVWTLTIQSEPFDLLRTADRLFDQVQTLDEASVEDIKLMVKRSHGLDEERRQKRSTDYDELFSREKGVYILSDIVDVAKIPARFPNDINTLFSRNMGFIACLEANGSNPEIRLANDMVLYQYSPIHGISEIGRVPVLGGIKTAMHSFRNTLYLITAEHEADSSPDSFEGSVLYKLVEHRGHISLEKIQILNVIEPNYVEFWQHQDEFYLAVGSNPGNDTLRTGTLIYRWMGHHFDCIQRISSKLVKTVVPFSIGSLMYLVIANYQDEHGNTDIVSNIYQFHLEDLKFHLYQSIETHGAQHIAHFAFDDEETKKSEHFLAVANYIGRNSNGALTSFLESVIYKFDGNRFVPFQSLKLLGASQWLPVKGPNGEFLLLVSHSNGLRGYQYDGWRFSQVSLKFRQSALGENIQTMRSFTYYGEIYLTIADKSSHGEDVNMWKLSFKNQNDLEEKYNKVKTWCESMTLTLNEDNVTETINKLHGAAQLLPESEKIQVEHLTLSDPQHEAIRQIESLSQEASQLNQVLNDAETSINKQGTDHEIPIVIGSRIIPHLEIRCQTPKCVEFRNLQVSNVNGQHFQEFLDNVVFLTDGSIEDSGTVFEEVSVVEELSSGSINGHPSATLVDVFSETLVNSELVVNGTVFINNDFNIDGTFDGLVPDKSHLLLYDQNQVIDDKVVMGLLKVNNLKLSGNLNKHPIEELIRHPEMNLQNEYQQLNVNNLIVDGFINGHLVQGLIESAVKEPEGREFQGDLDIVNLEVKEVLVDSKEIYGSPVSKILVSNPCLSQPLTEESSEKESPTFRSNKAPLENGKPGFPNLLDPDEDLIIIVEGTLKVLDVTDQTVSVSLLDILNNSYYLDETAIDSPVKFDRVQAERVEAEIISGIKPESWIVKNSPEVQHIHGKKTFLSNVHVRREALVKKVNEMDVSSIAYAQQDEILHGDWIFDTITCNELSTNLTNLGNNSVAKASFLTIKESLEIESLQAGSLNVKGTIDRVSWNDFLGDSIFDLNDFVESEKTIRGIVQVENLNLKSRINDLLVDELVDVTSKNVRTIVLDKDVSLEGPLNAGDLTFQGTIDNILGRNFQQEWMMQNINQTIWIPVAFENVQLNTGAILKNETVNNINLKKLFSRSLKINEDAKIKYLYALEKVKVGDLEVGGTVNGADFRSSVVRSMGGKRQDMSGDWLFDKDLVVNGSFVVEGFISGLNISYLCLSKPSENPNLLVIGGLSFLKEPRFVKVNDVNIEEKRKEIWMKNENTSLTGGQINFRDVRFQHKSRLWGFLNNFNLTLINRNYISKTISRVASADFDLDNMVIGKWCRMRKANVEGTVNGMNLNAWLKNVLLQDEQQILQGKPNFNIFEASDVVLEGTLNRLNLSTDVLRYDVEDAVVQGEKTFESLRVLNMTIATGAKIQGVDVVSWKNALFTPTGDSTFTQNLLINSPDFYGSVTVLGKVNGLRFDRDNLLKRKGNQVVRGRKHFQVTNGSSGSNAILRIKNLTFTGFIGGLDVESLMKMQAYSDRDLVFTEAQTFTRGFDVGSVLVEGLFQGVNVSEMCHDLINPVNAKELKRGFEGLAARANELIGVAKGRAFFFDYLESIQTLKPNVKAVVPTVDSRGHFLSVLTPNLMRLMSWDEYSESFVNAGESLTLKDNITFVTSEASGESPFLYMEGGDSGKIFMWDRLQEIDERDASCVTSFRLTALNKSCIFIGHRYNSSRIVCTSLVTGDFRTYQWLESKGSVQATVLTVNDEVYLAVINKEEIVDKFENSLTIYRFDNKLQHFYESHTLAEVNPVAVSSVSYKGNHYLVSAGGHLPESVHNSVISIFRFNKNHKVFVRSKSIQVDTPVDVHFTLLPSLELALYVLTSNPTKPLVVYLHRGVAGFVEETSGLSLYPGSNLYSFTDSKDRHFVVIVGFGRGQILKAGFKGGRNL